MNSSLSLEDFELIEDYIAGSLDSAKLEEVRMRTISDQEFAAHIEEIKGLQFGVERAVLASKLDSFHSELSHLDKNAQQRKIRPLWFWGVAASLFLIMSAGVWWIMGEKSSGEKLYQAYFKTDPGLVTSMSAGSGYDFDRAMVDYKSGEYLKAKEAFESLLKKSSQNDTLIYFLAMSELNLQNDQAAEKLLLAVSEDTASGFSKDSFWYLGLLALKEEDYALAKKYVNQSGRPKSNELIQALEEASGK
ncbi:tol-pal system YbgF family protein [Algoriphagus sp. A40]|uniref:tetratricopeptide repeat protein n=1 Tax=Algoriphagus sp. A40 TaxID=1945863 RepID=UPI00098660DB|nr:tetratricopeptide repeat protein [Algoriphagus sp. A40]OOG70619.1 hypothetical protein B0E43_18705 [Algoriphagus sp. A40]